MSTITVSSPLVTLTTDFGTEDAYVAVLKGVLLSVHREIRIVDLSHALPPHEILPAALLLREACPRFPLGTIHVAVIDPGVGGQRRPVLLRIDGSFYIGPDNGIFGLLLRDRALEGAWELTNPAYFLDAVGQTFHGRDIFAPCAAHLASGVLPRAFGPVLEDPVTLDVPPCTPAPEALAGEVLWIDHFGNCITNIRGADVARWAAERPFRIEAAGRTIPGISPSYDSVPVLAPLALYGSTGALEIACNQARADQRLGLRTGDPVVLKPAT